MQGAFSRLHMTDHETTPDLTTPVQYLKGVGPRRAELLERLDVRTVTDLLFFFPRSYQDWSELVPLAELEEGQSASVCGIVQKVELRPTGRGRTMLTVTIADHDQQLSALWFNQPYLKDRFQAGFPVMFSGTFQQRKGRWEITHPQVVHLEDDEDPPVGQILPVYPLTEGVNQFQMRRLVWQVIEDYTAALGETFPVSFLQAHQLLPIHEALRQIHQPADEESLGNARRRFVFQELLVLQLALAIRRWNRTERSRAPALPSSAKIHSRITRLFPFQLTADQEQAIEEISHDMGQEVPMNRLLQGDVGSGKTAVAEYALLQAVAHGWQAVLMAPTEILAIQHARTVTRDLQNSRVRIALLTGSLSAAERTERLAQIAAGEVDLVIGTHAVAQEGVEFARLGLVIIDEQHKFGVQQRAVLKQAGLDPHYLVMTATPIPRTVAMTLFGDLDTSTLRQGPHQQTINTYCEPAEKSEQWWDFYRKKLREGRQGYVISPLVEQSEHRDLVSVEECFEGLTNGELSDFRLGLVHGRLPAREKEKVMQDFAEGKIQVLVATSVVEVGVDVPNATLMTTVGGQQFGLAQLHQLRGRIGRGKHTGYICVFAEPANSEAEKRLEAFVGTTDGFELAEIDFALRGPGELFGFRQHGMPPLHIADLSRDMELLIEARTVAQQMIDTDPGLADPELAKLRHMVLSRYGRSLELGDVG